MLFCQLSNMMRLGLLGRYFSFSQIGVKVFMAYFCFVQYDKCKEINVSDVHDFGSCKSLWNIRQRGIKLSFLHTLIFLK